SKTPPSATCRSRSRRSTITSANRRFTARRFKEIRNGAHGPLCQARPRGGGARLPAVPGRAREADLPERVEGSVGGVAQASDDAGQREPPVARRCPREKVAGRADGAALLWRRRRNAVGVRATDVT